jgi:hypothetical protein
MESTDRLLAALEAHLQAKHYSGYDPFDALNSPILSALTVDRRLPGILFVQLLKKCPWNIRPLLLIKEGINPKGFGLLLSAYSIKYKMTHDEKDLQQARYFAAWLAANHSPGYAGHGWGYNFDWPNRNAFFPKGLPTIVNTVFIANGFLDLFEVTRDDAYLNVAKSAGCFITRDLKRHIVNDTICFSYTSLDTSRIHNANMLGAGFLALLQQLTGQKQLRELADRSMRFSLQCQQDDGAWYYGEGWKQHWIDSFHTGYNLLALYDYIHYSGKTDAEQYLIRGYDYYLNTFFTRNGEVRYFHNGLFPLDCHAFAHALLTLTRLRHLSPAKSDELAVRVLHRMREIFWDQKRGCFGYQRGRWYLNKIDYIRWVQIWAFYALLVREYAAGGGRKNV